MVTIATHNRFTEKTKEKQKRKNKTIATAMKHLVTSLVIITKKVSKKNKMRQKHLEYSVIYFNLGTVLEAEYFDSYGDSSAGNRLKAYLNGILG